MKPIIGIVVCGIEDHHQYVSTTYVSCIERSGGIPFILPYVQDYELTKYYLSFCDRFLFCGGDDVSPLLYGEDLIASYVKSDINIDNFHISLMRQILSSQKPVLAICRGMQIMNIALGGTLYQDILLRPEHSLNHMQQSATRSDPCHKITFNNNSKLFIFSCFPKHVNSFHHQCIHTLGENITVIANSSDNIAEVIEVRNHPFALGLQWHPECMYDTSKKVRELFKKFCNTNI